MTELEKLMNLHEEFEDGLIEFDKEIWDKKKEAYLSIVNKDKNRELCEIFFPEATINKSFSGGYEVVISTPLATSGSYSFQVDENDDEDELWDDIDHHMERSIRTLGLDWINDRIDLNKLRQENVNISDLVDSFCYDLLVDKDGFDTIKYLMGTINF